MLHHSDRTTASRAVVQSLVNVEITVDTEWLAAFRTRVCLNFKVQKKEKKYNICTDSLYAHRYMHEQHLCNCGLRS